MTGTGKTEPKQSKQSIQVTIVSVFVLLLLLLLLLGAKHRRCKDTYCFRWLSSSDSSAHVFLKTLLFRTCTKHLVRFSPKLAVIIFRPCWQEVVQLTKPTRIAHQQICKFALAYCDEIWWYLSSNHNHDLRVGYLQFRHSATNWSFLLQNRFLNRAL